jgi:hypothetical protein
VGYVSYCDVSYLRYPKPNNEWFYNLYLLNLLSPPVVRKKYNLYFFLYVGPVHDILLQIVFYSLHWLCCWLLCPTWYIIYKLWIDFFPEFRRKRKGNMDLSQPNKLCVCPNHLNKISLNLNVLPLLLQVLFVVRRRWLHINTCHGNSKPRSKIWCSAKVQCFH